MVAILEAGYGHEPRNVTTKVQNMKIFRLKNEDFEKFKISQQTVNFEGFASKIHSGVLPVTRRAYLHMI